MYAVFIDSCTDGKHETSVHMFTSETDANLYAELCHNQDFTVMVVGEPAAIEFLVKELCDD